MIINKNHSIISGENIDLKKFKLLKNSKFIEVILKKNDYLYIPSGWTHWVFTKEKTLSISYEIIFDKINSTKFSKNTLLNNMIKNIPFSGNYKDFNYNYEKFISNNLENNFDFEYNEYDDTAPVRKPFKVKKTDILHCPLKKIYENSLNIKNKFLYSPGNKIYFSKNCKEIINFDNQKELKEIPNFCNFKNNCDCNFDYVNSVWFSFNSNISSGIHYDIMHNIIFVVDGEKKILLCPPYFNIFLYFTSLSEL